MKPSRSDRSSESSTLSQHASRRGFIKGGSMMLAGGALGTALSVAKGAHAFGDDKIRVALVGCGRRGIQVALALLAQSQSEMRGSASVAGTARDKRLQRDDESSTSGAVELVSMADAFAHPVQTAYRTLRGRFPDQVSDRRFIGLNAYQDAMATEADIVILAAPPVFRPIHFASAVAAKKHVFMEKPVAIDSPGVRSVLDSGVLAAKHSLAVVCGFSHRHDPRFLQTIEQIHAGLIGDPVFARAYCNVGAVRLQPRRRNESELEYQLRNWKHFAHFGGESLVEQHVLGLDVLNWALQATPLTAQGQGGWMLPAPDLTDSGFDHSSVEFKYPGIARALSQCRRASGCWNNVSEHIQGTNGYAEVSNGRLYSNQGELIWKCDLKTNRDQALSQQCEQFIRALRAGDRPNELEHAAGSTLTALMGATASRTGKIVRWDEMRKSDDELFDPSMLRSLADPLPRSAIRST